MICLKECDRPNIGNLLNMIMPLLDENIVLATNEKLNIKAKRLEQSFKVKF